MNPYNGFTGNERQLSWDIQKLAIKQGIISLGPCSVTGQTTGQLMPHLENYDRPFDEFYTVGVEFHMNLHSRFKSPMSWIKFMLELRAGYVPKIFFSPMDYFKSPQSKRFWSNKATMAEAEAFEIDESKWWELLPLQEFDYRLRYPTTEPSENTKEILNALKNETYNR